MSTHQIDALRDLEQTIYDAYTAVENAQRKVAAAHSKAIAYRYVAERDHERAQEQNT